MTIYERIKMLRTQKGMTQIELAQKVGLKSRSSINKIELGQRDISQTKIKLFANALGVSCNYLMDGEEPTQDTRPLPPNCFPISRRRYRMLGKVACGEPIYADEDRESYVLSGTDMDVDFCLTASGDSMVGARIYDGDIVFIRSQEMVDNGEIAAVVIGDEATLKRVYYDREAAKLVLSAENPKYNPLVYVGEELNNIRILGKAVAFQSDVK